MKSKALILTTAIVGALLSLSMVLAKANTKNAEVWVDSLNLSGMTTGWGTPHANLSAQGNPLRIGGSTFIHGVGTHADSQFDIILGEKAKEFDATVGVDDETGGRGAVIFRVDANGKAYQTSILRSGQHAEITVPLTGAKHMRMLVKSTDAGNGWCHADWANARIVLAENVNALPAQPDSAAFLNAPARYSIEPTVSTPAIHGSPVVGATPGRPFLFRIAATGSNPKVYSVTNLPSGLSLNSQTGIIAGSLKTACSTRVTITVRNKYGVTKRYLTIIGGENKLAQTPPMGWNSWNVWAGAIDQSKMKAAVDNILSSGLADHGYQYVNIDDTWEGNRDANGNVLTNNRFPNITEFTSYAHKLGLKAGIYSSPGPKTCAGYVGCYAYEYQDAKTYGKWGFDYLKYDWCSYQAKDRSLAELQKPYAKMFNALQSSGRDIVYSLCQYGMGDVWKWGKSVGGNVWRTTGDIQDNWNSMHSIYESQNGHEAYAGPGHWNDPDMLVVGQVGWGWPHKSGLTPNEQIVHISMWSLLSAPLIVGCDLTKLDTFTKAILTNDEVIDIDQDSLGKAAHCVSSVDGAEVWARPLADGGTAAGLVNTNVEPTVVKVKWTELGIKGKRGVRDLWLHKNVGSFSSEYSVEVPAHGCVLIKVAGR